MMEHLEDLIAAGNSDLNMEFLSKAKNLGLPTKRNEEWKFSPLGSWISNLEHSDSLIREGQSAFEVIEQEDRILINLLDKTSDVFSNKSILPGLLLSYSGNEKSTFSGVHDEDFFPTLNRGLKPEFFTLKVEDNVQLEKPILLSLHTSKEPLPGWEVLRIRIELGRNAEAKIVEDVHEKDNQGYVRNVLREIDLSPNSKLEYNHIQAFSKGIRHIGYTVVKQSRDSQITSNNFSISGDFIRNNLYIQLDEEGSHAEMNGLFIPGEGMLMDNHTQVDHKIAHCTSDENYKGVILNKGTGVFNGKIFVREDAQKTQAFQSNKNILLGDNSTIHTKPQLEIWADDVKCTHGATTGRLDGEQLFYLQSRGIGLQEAQAILTKAFAYEILEKVSIPWLKEELNKELEQVLEA